MAKKLILFLTSVAILWGVVVLAESANRTQDVPKHQPVANWPKLPDGFQFGQVTAAATDSADNVYIFHRGKQPIMVFDHGGTFLRSWGDDLVKNAHGLRIDKDDNVWITDIGNHLVMKFDAKGKLLLAVGTKDKPGETREQFNKPADVAVTPAGDFYVADGYGNSRVVKFSREGKYLKEWGKKGKGEGEFNLPHAICLDAKGQVYVGDRENNRVQIFDADGKFLAQCPHRGAPLGLFISKMEMLLADGRANQVNHLTLEGKVQSHWGEKGMGPGQFDLPHWICLDSQGAIYVTESKGKRVQKFARR